LEAIASKENIVAATVPNSAARKENVNVAPNENSAAKDADEFIPVVDKFYSEEEVKSNKFLKEFFDNKERTYRSDHSGPFTLIKQATALGMHTSLSCERCSSITLNYYVKYNKMKCVKNPV